MRVDLFDFELPQERIALRPAEPRDSARMLVIDPAGRSSDEALRDMGVRDLGVRDLPDLLAPGDVLVVNDTRVIPARLRGVRDRDGNVARVEVTLHKREDGASWRAFARPAKRLQPGDRLRFGDTAEGYACELGHLDASIVECGEGGEVLLEFSLTEPYLDEAIERLGEMPLPPYIAGRRAADDKDTRDYQTLFAQKPGAVAAPTASLHFTPALLAALEARGVEIVRVTLHVGAGTFLPVKADDTQDHRMHAEYGVVTEEAASRLNAARTNGGRIVAAGTTSLRILETAAQDDGTIEPVARDTSIFITPGYRFRAVDVLMTNFHLPRSTLFMLVSAFCGLETMQQAYAHAIAQQYRFYSYGDACLLFRAEGGHDE
ncbi:MAG: tRNA preQ1(34) S-adenosylmethionine ribosyltransferase-isomerase QueA [Hyphomicrobiales bacterium]|nr:tRNA preQ1(34) S-adenosylmethionine ribosyltransferase-isomerase QueA [Hyphomicrobiales bacterium]